MSRKFWVISAIVLGVFFILALASGGGFLLYRQNQTRQWLAEGEEAFEKGDWDSAIRRYSFYLNRERDDIDTLKKYAEASLKRAGDRRLNLTQAATAYRQILHYEPSNREAEQALFDIQKKLGAWHEVHYLAGRMLEKEPENIDLKHEQAYALDKIGNRNDATAAYRELIDQGIAKPDVYANLARLLRATNLTEQAQDVLKQAVERHPKDPRTYVARGEYFLEEQNIAAAREELDKAKALAADDQDVLMLQSRVAMSEKDYDTAIEAARAVLERDPSQARMYAVLSQALAEKGENAASLDVLRNVDPTVRVDNPELFVRFAEQLINERKLDEAREVIAAYEKSYPNHQAPLSYLRGRESLAEGDADAAADYLSAVVEQNPAMAPGRFFLAVANLMQGKPKEARSHLEIYLKDNPTDENAKNLLAEAKGIRLDPEQLVQVAQSVLNSENARPETLVSTALALLNSAVPAGTVVSQLDTIENLFDRAIEKAPAEPRAYEGLADAYVAANNLEKARQTLSRAEQAGIPFTALARAHANVALAEGRPDEAWECFQKGISGDGASVSNVRQWSRLFSLRDQPSLARRALASGAEALPGEAERAELAVESIVLELRLGKDAEALRLLAGVESQVAGHKDAESALSRVKEQLVWRLMGQGSPSELEEARKILVQSGGDEQEDPMLLTLQGMMHLRAAPPAFDKAEAAFKKALERDPESVVALMGMASLASLRGALSQALEFSSKAANAAPQSGSIDLWRAEILFRMQRYLEARNLLESVLSETPENAPALELLVNTYLATNQLREAERTLERLRARVESGNGNAGILDVLQGRVLLEKGNASEAEGILRKQYADNPDDFPIVRSLAFALTQENRNAEAEEILKKYAENHSKDADVFVALARLYLATNDPSKMDAASTALTRALAVNRDYLPALRVLVDMQLQRGTPSSILAACDRYLRHDPLNAGVLFAKASVLSREPGRDQEAFEAIEQAIAQERQPEYLALRGMLSVRKQSYAGALKDLREASLGNTETSAEFDAAFAEAYWGVGEKDLSKTYYESAVAKAKTGNMGVPPWLKRLQEKMGQEN
ncbi:MAG TPA: tetratricopeptide repeat protein [Candidatus Hydrogenedentes bacterium]|nr:tetratricopeptide repeat protein [Candidatus Hydrogenedentota bacterium]